MKPTHLLLSTCSIHRLIMSDPNAAPAKTLSALFSSVGDNTTKHEQEMITVSRRVMRKLAAPMVAQMKITERTGPVRLLDNACGSGLFTQEVLDVLSSEVVDQSTFLCMDSSQGMVDLVKKRVAVEGWKNVEAQTANAMVCSLEC